MATSTPSIEIFPLLSISILLAPAWSVIFVAASIVMSADLEVTEIAPPVDVMVISFFTVVDCVAS